MAKDFTCRDCGVDTCKMQEFYMLTNEVWDEAVADTKIILCIGCVEDRLGRRLAVKDFMDCIANTEVHKMSIRLLDRLMIKTIC